MFQDMYGDLPVMSTEVLALRKELWEADGYHLIYNVPRFGAGVTKQAPVRPFAGLCVAFLMLLRKDKQMFCPQVGDRPRAYQVGWGDTVQGYGLFSIANTGQNQWTGYKDNSFPGFNAGYYYSYFYFKDDETLHGFINNKDLKDDSAHPYKVSEASATILFGQENWHEVETLEVHWVLWGSPQNKGSKPSPSLMNQLFVRGNRGDYDYKDITIFDIRNGAVITVIAKYEANTHSNKQSRPEQGPFFGLGRAVEGSYFIQTFPECRDTSTVYTFRINVTLQGAVVYYKHLARAITTNKYTQNTSEDFHYFVLANVKPLRIHIETMGYRWLS